MVRELLVMPFPSMPQQLLVVIFLLASSYWAFSRASRRNKALPPGPPVLPILGNLHLFPAKWPHYQFTKWGALQLLPTIMEHRLTSHCFFVLAAEYGSIFALQMMHQTIIVLNTPTAIKDVIERKSISTSNRPESHIADMIIPNNENFGMSTDRE